MPALRVSLSPTSSPLTPSLPSLAHPAVDPPASLFPSVLRRSCAAALCVAKQPLHYVFYAGVRFGPQPWHRSPRPSRDGHIASFGAPTFLTHNPIPKPGSSVGEGFLKCCVSSGSSDSVNGSFIQLGLRFSHFEFLDLVLFEYTLRWRPRVFSASPPPRLLLSKRLCCFLYFFAYVSLFLCDVVCGLFSF